jgi:tetratricopeptide (TPR) repeat protein
MDGRKSLMLALGLLAAVGGCTPASKQTTGDQSVGRITFMDDSKPPPPQDPNEPPVQAHAPTLVAAGDYYIREAAGRDDVPAVQSQLRDKARKAYQQALRVDPKCLPAYQALANLYLVLDDREHAVATYQRALKMAPANHQLWFDLGMCFARDKDWDNALPNLRKAVDLDPENRQYVNMLGFALARSGRFDESLACFKRVQGEARAHYNQARMLQYLGQTDLCRQHLQLALQADPQLDSAQDLLARLTAPDAPTVQQTCYQQPAGQQTPDATSHPGESPAGPGPDGQR